MPDREPDVIERMSRAHDDAYMKWFEDHKNSGYSKQTGPTAMLAAVREMVGAIQHDKRFVGMTCQLMDLIEDHERRAAGKGQGL